MGDIPSHYTIMKTICVILVCLMYFCSDHRVAAASIRVDSSAEVEDGLLHIVLDMRNIMGDHLKSKRGLDFGLGRGYSGSQAARHQLGLYQANYDGGPGK